LSLRSWVNLTTTDFSDLDPERTLVLLPLGATEQHGPHLPLGTDLLLVEEVLRRLVERFEVESDLHILVLPSLWCTKSNEHASFAGSIYLTAETLIRLVRDIAASVAASGLRKLVFMNWHGGNVDLLAMLLADIRQMYGLLTFLVDGPGLFLAPYNPPDEDQLAFHAAFYETSLMLAAYPDLVKPGPFDGIGSDLKRGRFARNFAGFKYLHPKTGVVRVGWVTPDWSEDGVIGNPAGASGEIGEGELLKQVIEIEEILREIARFRYHQ
jgi:creatinine amidohydrolase